uniref:Uncharacterized protein n=1 Tax=Trypanosoma congolense (strain IL3000) TaxID=1068625 RepID=G0UXX6_TRYCI|nr:conserved hypothetical protein [Trypanosoma congolense IL3000]
MSVCPPPWSELTEEEVSQRLSLLASPSPTPGEMRLKFGPHAVFSTGIEEIDRLLPDSGLAFGTVLEMFGPPASGKSRLVRQIISSFAVRGALEWTSVETAGERSTGHSPMQRVRRDHMSPYVVSCCAPLDWCVFYLVSDPSSFSARRMQESLEVALKSALAKSVHCSVDNEGLLDDVMQRIKVVNFAAPNDLLNFFRYLYRDEYAASMHHGNQRRVLIAVDSVAWLWDHPNCGATNHSRHWMAAELVRDLHNALTIGNGYRFEYRDDFKTQQVSPVASYSLYNGEFSSGGVVAIFVNGSANMRYKPVLPDPLGVPVWLAAGADIRLFVESVATTNESSQDNDEVDEGNSTIQKCALPKCVTRVQITKGNGFSVCGARDILLK